MTDLSKVTRFEVIDSTNCEACVGRGTIHIGGQPERLECPACHGLGIKGREVIFHSKGKQVESSLQDDGRTLKIFVSKRQ
jgi:DnaJ-class molecular chaperone